MAEKKFQAEVIVWIKAWHEKMWDVYVEGGCSEVPEAGGAYKEVGEDKKDIARFGEPQIPGLGGWLWSLGSANPRILLET